MVQLKIRFNIQNLIFKSVQFEIAIFEKYANKIENRLDDECSIEDVLKDNADYLQGAKKYRLNYVLINEQYKIDIDLDN